MDGRRVGLPTRGVPMFFRVVAVVNEERHPKILRQLAAPSLLPHRDQPALFRCPASCGATIQHILHSRTIIDGAAMSNGSQSHSSSSCEFDTFRKPSTASYYSRTWKSMRRRF